MKGFLGILLLPLARFCVRNGISLAECVAALKSALLTVSAESLQERGEPITASRLTVMTGVHRKDSGEFLKGRAPKRDTLAPVIHVLGCWHTRKRYLDERGNPRTLSIGSENSQFARLVREVSADIHPHTILRELERLGLVAVTDTSVRPLRSSLISSLNDEQTATLISRDIEELLCSAEENIQAGSTRPNHHTTTTFDNIPAEYAEPLRAWLRREAGLFHRKVRDHVAKFDRDLADTSLPEAGRGTIRFSFGSFGRICAQKGKRDDAA